MGRPATSTWSTDFLLREGFSREEIGKWLKNKSIPWQRRRKLLRVVTGTFPCGQQLVKYGYRGKAECILCKKAYEESGGSWKGELPKETIGHIQSAGCLGQKEVVTAAHNACIRELFIASECVVYTSFLRIGSHLLSRTPNAFRFLLNDSSTLMDPHVPPTNTI